MHQIEHIIWEFCTSRPQSTVGNTAPGTVSMVTTDIPGCSEHLNSQRDNFL